MPASSRSRHGRCGGGSKTFTQSWGPPTGSELVSRQLDATGFEHPGHVRTIRNSPRADDSLSPDRAGPSVRIERRGSPSGPVPRGDGWQRPVQRAGRRGPQLLVIACGSTMRPYPGQRGAPVRRWAGRQPGGRGSGCVGQIPKGCSLLSAAAIRAFAVTPAGVCGCGWLWAGGCGRAGGAAAGRRVPIRRVRGRPRPGRRRGGGSVGGASAVVPRR